MDNISRGSTPQVIIDCEVNPNSFTNGYLTISQGHTKLSDLVVVVEKSLSDLVLDGETKTIHYILQQEETILLDPLKPCFIQFRAIDSEGNELHTKMAEYRVDEILHKEVIE